MADTNLKSETNNGVLDIFSDATEQEMEQFVDENDEMFDLLGMSEEEKQKAATQLAAEDDTYASRADSQPEQTQDSFSEEERLNNLLDDIFDENKSEDGDSKADTEEAAPDASAPAQESEQTQDSGAQTPEEDTTDMDMLSDLVADAALASMQEAEENLADITSAADLTNVASAEETSANVQDNSTSDGDHVEVEADATDYDGEFDGIEISEDILDGVDLDEDLTKLAQDSAMDDLVEDTKLSKREQKKREKQALKELKKAEKEQRRAEKNASKQGDDVSSEDAVTSGEENLDDETSGMLDALSEQLDSVADDTAVAQESQADSMSFWQKASLVLFGPEEEEDEGPTEEELAAKKAKKEAKEAKKEEKKKQKEEKAGEKAVKKQQAQEMAVVKKAAAKDKKEKIRQEEEAEDAKERSINPKTVTTIVGILLILLIVVVFGTNQFNYRMVITRAVNYFEMQKYKMAYEQIVGVDVKDRDQQIKDKIYCVMYVQQQIDSYNNFCKLEMYENALDSLVKGVSKYDAHIEEARELGIEADLDGLRDLIEKELQQQFGLSMDTVEQWIQMDQVEYSKQLQAYVASMQFTEE